MDRRKFLGSIGATALGAALLDRLSLPSSSAIAATRGAIDVTQVPINLVDNPELGEVGGTYHLEYDDLNRDILVVQVSKDKYVGVDIKCPHRGCDVSYSKEKKDFYCPCHGSEFDCYGHVLTGPAVSNLTYYHAERKGDEVMVTVFGPDDKVPANCVAPPVDTTGRSSNDSTFGH